MLTSPTFLHTSPHTLPILIYIFSPPKCIFNCVVVCWMGGSPLPYIASPRVDPQFDLRGGTMHVRDGCRGAMGDCWRKMGLNGPNKGSAEPFFVVFWAHLQSVYSLWAPRGDRGVHSWRYVGLQCHLGPRIHVCAAVFVESVFSLGLGLICVRMWAL